MEMANRFLDRSITQETPIETLVLSRACSSEITAGNAFPTGIGHSAPQNLQSSWPLPIASRTLFPSPILIAGRWTINSYQRFEPRFKVGASLAGCSAGNVSEKFSCKLGTHKLRFHDRVYRSGCSEMRFT